jgi:hypothetical protein
MEREATVGGSSALGKGRREVPELVGWCVMGRSIMLCATKIDIAYSPVAYNLTSHAWMLHMPFIELALIYH